MPAATRDDLRISTLRKLYLSGERLPAELLAALMARIHLHERKGVWITLCTPDQIHAQLATLDSRRRLGRPLPLAGIPFAVKDNIDVAGLPTTAACPAYSHVPARSATVVERLCAAGAIVVGKTNLDQF